MRAVSNGVAKDMIRLSGLRPFEDIDIVYSGLRPGEKLYEELELKGENIAKTRHPKIFVGQIAPLAPDQVDFTLRRLTELAANGERGAIRSFLADLLPESTLDAEGPIVELVFQQSQSVLKQTRSSQQHIPNRIYASTAKQQ